jgi:hypothetical protein
VLENLTQNQFRIADIEARKKRIARLESEAEAENRKRAAEAAALVDDSTLVKEIAGLAQREEQLLAKRGAEKEQKQAVMAERLREHENQLLAAGRQEEESAGCNAGRTPSGGGSENLGPPSVG